MVMITINAERGGATLVPDHREHVDFAGILGRAGEMGKMGESDCDKRQSGHRDNCSVQ